MVSSVDQYYKSITLHVCVQIYRIHSTESLDFTSSGAVLLSALIPVVGQSLNDVLCFYLCLSFTLGTILIINK